MTVQELIEKLQQMPDDMEVKIGYDYGDYWNTSVCGYIGSVDILDVKFSDYHRMDKILDWDSDDQPEKQIVVLSNL